MAPPDPLKDLLELVRTAAREGVVEGLRMERAAEAEPIAPLLDKRAIANALRVSMATVDRLCRQNRIPFVPVGDVRRFDLHAVRTALAASREPADHAPGSGPDLARGCPAPSGVRLLSRRTRKSNNQGTGG